MTNEPESFTIWHGLFLAEFFCLLVSLATTIVPSKTGSTTGLADAFYEDPTYLQEFWVNLAGIHAVLGLMALGLVVWIRLTGAKRS